MGDYLWLLALAAAWRQDADDDTGNAVMSHIDALSGLLNTPPSNAVNDPLALLLVLVLVLIWLRVNSVAKLLNRGALPPIFVANGPASISHPALPAIPLPAWSARYNSGLLTQTPTVSYRALPHTRRGFGR